MAKKIISGVVFVLLIAGMVPVVSALGVRNVEGFAAYRTLRDQCRELQKEYSSALRATKVRLKAGEITRQEAIASVRNLRGERKETCVAARASAADLRKALKSAEPSAENPPAVSESGVLMLSSASFARLAAIPLKYAYTEAGGENVSPQFSWTGGSGNIQSYALLMYDPHPTAQNYVHWCVTGIPAGTTSFAEGEQAGTPWTNGYTAGYEGPFPPAGDGVHTYQFKLLGLSAAETVNPLDATSGYCTLESFNAATTDIAVAEGWYEATYIRY